MKNCIFKIFIMLAAAGALSACRYDVEQPPVVVPPTQEEIARSQFGKISSNANVSLYGDVLGYFENSQEMERSKTTCKGAICGVGFFAYAGPSSFSPQHFNLELLEKQGNIRLARGTFKGRFIDAVTYGGWLEHSFFGSHFDEFINEIDPEYGGMRIVNFAVGNSTGENPSIGGGSAKWAGIMLGRDIRASASRGQALRGDAKLTVKFDEFGSEADIEFANIVDLKSGKVQISDITWKKLDLTNGGFRRKEASNDYISGQFFGPAAQEVGGIFERSNVAGSFGAKREAR